MKKTSLFWILLPSYWILIGLALCTVAVYTFHSMSDLYFQTLEKDLSTRAILFGNQIQTTDVAALDSICKEMGKSASTRFTVIALDGMVLGDSDENPAAMESHNERPEIRQALGGTTGVHRRYSLTVQQEMMYVAVPQRDHGRNILYAVRAALPMTDIQGELNQMMTRVITVAFLIGLLAMGVCTLVVRRITAPLHGMGDAARQFSAGDFSHRIPRQKASEFDELAETLNTMSEQLNHLEMVRADFVANVSHELKTPITSIKGFVETLLSNDWDHDPDTRRFLGIINQQSGRLNAIIDDLLTLSRLEQKEGHVLKEPCNLESVLSNAIDLCQLHAEKKNTNLSMICPDHLAFPINAPLLEQALVNLIINAVKYSEPDKTVQIHARKQDNMVVISVQDEGFGIENKHLDRLFERFYRVDTARSRKLGGTGLGLSIVKHIVHVHNGTVAVESKLGKGSIFTLFLPDGS